MTLVAAACMFTAVMETRPKC